MMSRCYTSFEMPHTPPKKEPIELDVALRACRLPHQPRPVDRKEVSAPMLSEIKESVFAEKFREYNVRDSRFPNDPQYWTEVYLQETGGCHLFTGPAYADCMAMGGWYI